MENKDKVLFSEREFLNSPGHGGVAAIHIAVTQNSYGYDYTELIISDCTRQISLDLSFEDEREFKNTEYKVKTIIEVLSKFQKALPELREVIIKEREKKKAEKKKKGNTSLKDQIDPLI